MATIYALAALVFAALAVGIPLVGVRLVEHRLS
jgi:hypothetical protein